MNMESSSKLPLSFSSKTIAIPDFCDMARFDKMMRDWSFATGLATVAVGKDGKYLTGYYNFTDFCEKLTRKSPEGLRRCIECDKKGQGTYLCHAGLVDFAAPITLEDGTVLGNIVGGQVLPEKPDEAKFRATARELGIDEDRYVEELRKVNIRSHEQIQASFDLLTAAITMFVRASYAEKMNTQSLRERSDIISSLGNLYFCDFFLDLVTDTYKELDSTSWARDVLKPYAGLPASVISSKLLSLVVTPDFQKDFAAFSDFSTLKERLHNRKSVSMEYISTNSGWCRAIFIPVKKDSSDNPTKVIFAIQDINEEKFKELAIQETLRKAAEEANDANKAKTDFLSRMSHDIRTPLNGIAGMTYLSLQENNPPKTTEYLKKIDTSSHFLLGLINDILDMAKVESNKIVLHPEPYPLTEFNEYLDSVIRPLCEEKNIHFSSSIQMVKGLYPVQDKLRINQIVFNLLSNAVKFTPEGGQVAYSCVFTKKSENRLGMTLQVKDTGIGMSEDFQKHLFTPFTQESRSDIASNRGSGLGLAICKHMVDLMGGTIGVESRLGYGTTFTVKIDFDAVPEETALKPKQLSTDSVSGSYPHLKNAHILVFEDHPLNQEIAKALLESKGAIVEVANNGFEGLKTFRLSAPWFYSAILMDIRMPVMDGYEACQEIRSSSRPDATKIPIIAMTADAFSDDVNKCLAVGMNYHLAKPIEPDLLFSMLERVLSSAQ
jgi:signal transduction histidine kinase/CheY-like chemotaxis protein/ligand-binding sensor protein